MKKRIQKNKNLNNTISPVSKDISPLEAVEFLESFRVMLSEKDEPTELISLRVPRNLLKMLKTKAKLEDKKYQSLIVSYIRAGLKNSL